MKKNLIILVIVTALLLVTIPVLAASKTESLAAPIIESPENVSLERVDGWPYGAADAIAADVGREIIFLGSGGAILVIDVANPMAPTLLTDLIHTQGFVEDLFYDETTQRLYVAAGRGGMEIWDMQSPATPQQLSATEILYAGVDIPIEGITVEGNMAYIAGDWGYLHWIDVSDPANPVQIGFNGQAVRPTEVFATTTHVYAVGNDTGPFFEGDFSVFGIKPDGSLDFQGGRDFGICGSVYVEGPLAYVGCGDWYILDLTDPFLPTVGMLTIDAGNTILSGTHAYVASYSSGLHAIDISDPSTPVETSIYDSPGYANDLTRIGQYVYLADDHAGLRVVDISNPNAITEVSFYDTPGWTTYAAIQGNYAYVANGQDGLLIVDVTEPMSSTLTGRFDSSGIYDVAVQNDYAYVANVDTGLRVVDVSDPANPAETGFYSGFDAFRVDVQGNYAYVADAIVNQPYWLRVVDVSDPANPTEVGSIELGMLIWRVVARGNYVYVANDDTGLRIIDVSDPTQPVEVGTYLAPDVWDVSLQGNYAYIASTDWNGGFLIVDISDPTNPILVSQYNPTGWFHPYHVDVLGRFAYVSLQDELHLFDVADPANPILMETVDLPLDASGLTADGAYVFVADQDAGLPAFRNLESNSGINWGPDSTLATMPGTTVTHTFSLQNLGMTDQFTLAVSGNMWPTTLLASSPMTITSGQTVSLTVTVDVPHLLPDDSHSDIFTLTATAVSDPAVTSSVTGTTNAVIVAGADLNIVPTGQNGPPGSTVAYDFTISNMGNYTDSFSLSVQSGWNVTLPYTTTPLIPAGGTLEGTFWVTVPAGASVGDQDVATLVISSVWDPSVTAMMQVTTTASEQTYLIFLPAVLKE